MEGGWPVRLAPVSDALAEIPQQNQCRSSSLAVAVGSQPATRLPRTCPSEP